MPRYTIEGAQNFCVTADDPETAYGKAEPASRQFQPIRITGPQGLISLSELKREAEDEKRKKSG